MAVVASAPSAFAGELALFHTTDPLLSNSSVLVFHGPAATIGATSSRIQVHVFTPAGYGSSSRLAVSPNSPYYSAVSNLPREEQGDEVCRGLAFGLKKYFTELPDTVKKTWAVEAKCPAPSALFGDDHVAILASRMTRIENVEDAIRDLTLGFGEMKLSWMDVDVVLPAGSIKEVPTPSGLSVAGESDESDELAQRYGKYAELIGCLGDGVFLPTSNLKRAPSKMTAAGRGTSFLKHQKEGVRKELCELHCTEESYVDRIKELNELSSTLSADLNEGCQEQMRSIFPAGTQELVDLNSGFLASLRSILDDTEEGATKDIDESPEERPTSSRSQQDFSTDVQGIVAAAGCLCEWLPKFGDAYREYLKHQPESAQMLRSALKDTGSTVAAQLQEVGEQKLTSLLIEPVQRLPRYNLYVDSILKQLPVRHPALKPLLKARDVVTEICDEVGSSNGAEIVFEKLRSRVAGWSSEGPVTGRLVTAADFVELMPPYAPEGCDAGSGMFLLFTDSVVFLEKQSSNAPSARTLLTELESGPGLGRPAATRPTTPNDYRFIRRVQLESIDCLELHNGQALQITTHLKLDDAAHSPVMNVDSCQILRLDGSYERRAERLVEEIAKARVEGRFSEDEREFIKWEVRASDPAADTASLLSAVFEDSNPVHVGSRTTTASTRIIVDIDKHSNRPRAGQNGIRTVISASPLRDGLWRLAIDSIDGNGGREHVAVTELIPALRRRLASLMGMRFSINQPSMTACMLAKHADVLQSINLIAIVGEGGTETQNPRRGHSRKGSRSPKKLLSSILSSTGSGIQPTPHLKKDLPQLPPPMQLPRGPTASSTPKPPSRESRPSSKENEPPRPMSMSSMRSAEHLSGPIKKLEESLCTYMLALQARKGNIVGRSLKMRASADELAVNELYNSLLEDPNMMVLAAQATVDVLFAGFEKFLNVAWKEQVGQVLPFAVIQDIQSKAETMFPTDFDAHFKTTIAGLPPQNQRAFKGIMKLLADLLDGTGNDGDRGILTAAFAEVLVTEGNPHDYIALIDRFVDDPETYFGEPLEDVQRAAEASVYGHKRTRSANSASLTSNTSSLRRKFGFSTVSSQNSKSDQESKVSSMWRTLSKSTRGDSSPAGSLSARPASLHRSQSTDIDMRGGAQQRPGSQDSGPPKLPPFGEEKPTAGGVSDTGSLGLSTIGEHPSFLPTQPPRKKRRSSLSDLRNLEPPQPQSRPAWSPSQRPRTPASQDKALPTPPPPITPSQQGGSARFGSPTRGTPRSRLPPSFRKENSPPSSSTPERPKTSRAGKSEEVVITSKPTSSIPTLTSRPSTSLQKVHSYGAPRAGLSERPNGSNIGSKKPTTPPDKASKAPTPNPATVPATDSPARKLRMHSPQKLRERLHNEQSAIAAAHSTLQDELGKIGEELTSTALPARAGSIRNTPPPLHTKRSRAQTAHQPSPLVSGGANAAPAPNGSLGSINPAPPGTSDLAQRILKMEARLPTTLEALNTRLGGIQADLATSLAVSENKCRKLDELYREANGENEALYARFNDELSRILGRVRSGEGVEELRRVVGEKEDEAGRLRREVGRLRRENVGLRAQMKE